jgi:hypothetical protein
METVDLMFDGVKKACKLQSDRNGDFLFVAEDGSFVKFPKDSDLNEVIANYNEANSRKVRVIEETLTEENETQED